MVLNYFNIRNKPELQEYFSLRDLVSQIKAPMLILRGDSLEDTTHPTLTPSSCTPWSLTRVWPSCQPTRGEAFGG